MTSTPLSQSTRLLTCFLAAGLLAIPVHAAESSTILDAQGQLTSPTGAPLSRTTGPSLIDPGSAGAATVLARSAPGVVSVGITGGSFFSPGGITPVFDAGASTTSQMEFLVGGAPNLAVPVYIVLEIQGTGADDCDPARMIGCGMNFEMSASLGGVTWGLRRAANGVITNSFPGLAATGTQNSYVFNNTVTLGPVDVVSGWPAALNLHASLRFPYTASGFPSTTSFSGNVRIRAAVAPAAYLIVPSGQPVTTPTFIDPFAPALTNFTVSPANINFGLLPTGSTSDLIVTVTNPNPVTIFLNTASLANGAPFSVLGPTLPAAVPANGNLDVGVRFASVGVGSFNDTLSLSSALGNVAVPLTGQGVVVGVPPGQQIVNVLAFYDTSVQSGQLTGQGNGNSAAGRLGALRNMIKAAGDLIASGLQADACVQLRDALNRTDGLPQPPDFVAGLAAPQLATKIRELRTSMGCPN